MPDTIRSERLSLIPMTRGFLRASFGGDLAAAERELQIVLPADWPGEHAGLLALRLQQIEEDATVQPWLVRAMAERESGVMVGHIGFHDAPGAAYLRDYSPGGAEIGITVFSPFRRRGYAREAVLALTEWARRRHGVRRFVMSIRPDNKESQGLAAQLGYAKIGSHVDEIDGLEEILELRVE